MPRYNDQVCLKLTGTLRAHLEDEALACGRSLSNLIRQILIDHTAERVAGTSTQQREAA
ncbi:MAG: hypothetical protein WA832_03500 [Bradyrhizobium sp.]|jgi:hypothetical protein|uniref:hypothetical protein n=1 Tax=Bradyrhizobium sp. TaxID=376 RepID=UPI003BB139EE